MSPGTSGGQEPESSIPGVRYGRLESHADERGSFRELWRAGDEGSPDGAGEFVQANLSTSAPGVLRGLHLHRRQLDYWVVAAGRAFVALVDVRAALDDAAAPPSVETRELGPDDWVVIPPGVAHGFLALEPLELLYFVTNRYDGSDELGFAWDDPTVGIAWPTVAGVAGSRPILSTRDTSNPPLAELLTRVRGDRS
jgi:dTDP-4-dehydrorhamnose 3,5-epimerase